MKIGILGSSLEAIYLASYFAKLEAHVTLFGEADPLKTYEHYKSEVDQGYWFELLKNLQGKIVYSPNTVDRIQKSFIDEDESVSRMKDTFRVVTTKGEMEFYEDFDFLIETKTLQSSFLGGDSPAIHEEKNAKNDLGYYCEFEITEEILKETKGDVAVVGDFTKNEVFLNFLNTADLNLHFFQTSDEIKFLIDYEKSFEEQVNSFDKAKDKEPKRRIFQYPLSAITSLDYLEDREHLYITSEIPDFRAQDEHFTTQAIKTIAVDRLFHFGSFKQASGQFRSFILENEPGYYKIISEEWKNLSQLQAAAEKLKDEFLQYFTKA